MVGATNIYHQRCKIVDLLPPIAVQCSPEQCSASLQLSPGSPVASTGLPAALSRLNAAFVQLVTCSFSHACTHTHKSPGVSNLGHFSVMNAELWNPWSLRHPWRTTLASCSHTTRVCSGRPAIKTGARREGKSAGEGRDIPTSIQNQDSGNSIAKKSSFSLNPKPHHASEDGRTGNI